MATTLEHICEINDKDLNDNDIALALQRSEVVHPWMATTLEHNADYLESVAIRKELRPFKIMCIICHQYYIENSRTFGFTHS